MSTEFLTTDRRNQLLSDVILLLSRVNVVEEPGRLFESMLDVLVEYSESEFGFIGEVFIDELGKPYLKTHAITNIAWDQATRDVYDQNATTGFEFRNLQSLFGHVLTSGKAVISNEPAADFRRAGVPAGHPELTAFMGLPFYHRGDMVGMVGVANRVGGYNELIQNALEPILSSCSFVIDTFRVSKERQEFEVQLRDSEALHRGILDAAVDSIISIDERGTVISANSAVTKMFGYEPEDLIGRNVTLLMPPEIASQHDSYLSRYRDTGVARIIGVGREVTGRHRDGTELPLELAISEVRQDDQVLYTGILRDISDRKIVERERAAAYSQLVAVLNSCSQVSIIATNVDGLITVFNRGAENMLGYSADEMVGLQTAAIIHHAAEVKAYGEKLSKESGRHIEGFQVFIDRAQSESFDRKE